MDWGPLGDGVARLWGDLKGRANPPLQLGPESPKHDHITKATTQTQIGIAYPTVPIGHPDYYAAQGAVNVLSGGMSARLFTEVREKRGPCYAVSASYQVIKNLARLLCYPGPPHAPAQETLDVT